MAAPDGGGMSSVLRAVARYLFTGLKLLGQSHLQAGLLLEPSASSYPGPWFGPEPWFEPRPPSPEPQPSLEDERLRPRATVG